MVTSVVPSSSPASAAVALEVVDVDKDSVLYPGKFGSELRARIEMMVDDGTECRWDWRDADVGAAPQQSVGPGDSSLARFTAGCARSQLVKDSSLSKNSDLGGQIGDVCKSFGDKRLLQGVNFKSSLAKRTLLSSSSSTAISSLCIKGSDLFLCMRIRGRSTTVEYRDINAGGTNSNDGSLEMMGRFSFMLLEARMVLSSTKLRHSLFPCLTSEQN